MLINTIPFTEVRRPPMLVIKGTGGNACILFLDNIGRIATSSAQAGLTGQPTFLQDCSTDEFLNGSVNGNKRAVYAPTSKNYATSSWINRTAVTASAGFDYEKNQFWTTRTSGSEFSFVYADYNQQYKTGSAGTIINPTGANNAPRLVKQSTYFYRGKILLGHNSGSGLLGGGRLVSYDSASNSVSVFTASLAMYSGAPAFINNVRDINSPCYNHRTNEMMYAITIAGSTNIIQVVTRNDFDNLSNTPAGESYRYGPATGSSASTLVVVNNVYIPYLHETWVSISGNTRLFKYKMPQPYAGNPIGSWDNMLISGSVTGISNIGHMITNGGIEKLM